MSVELLVADIQQRFANQTFCRGTELAPVREIVPTGLRAVDELLDGGLLSGATHCISGEPTSGAASLLYRAVASAQAQSLPVVYLDMAGRFDQPNAAAAGIDIKGLSLLRWISPNNALFLIRALAERQLPGLLVIDNLLDLPLAQLKAILGDAPLTLLALAPLPLPGMQVTLECQRQNWLRERGDAVGFISELRLTAHPFLPFRQVRASFAIPRGGVCSARW